MIDKKKKILTYLKKNGQTATGKIAVIIRSNQWMAEKYLQELEEDKAIKKIVVPNATYWEILK